MDGSTIATTLLATLKLLETNPIIPLIASGGLTVWLISNLKSIWNTVTNFIVLLISFNIHNAYEDNRGIGYSTKDVLLVFNLIISSSKSLWERNKHLDLMERNSLSSETREFPTAVFPRENMGRHIDAFSSNNTYGFSIRLMYGKIVLCNRHQKPDGQKLMIYTDLQVFFARKKKFMERLEKDIDAKLELFHKSNTARQYVSVYYGSNNCYSASKKNKRSLDSIFANNNEHLELYNSIVDFINGRDTYRRLNYPYKFSALMHGKPGCGKSSTILAIASALNRDVEYINLSVSTVMTLVDTLNCDTDQKIFVFEDIDALNSNNFKDRESEDENTGLSSYTKIIAERDSLKVFSLSLSDLLNITDGLLSSDGSICIFTTNHIEKLDSALLRAGRMNKIIEFDYLNAKTASKMIEAYLGHGMENLVDGIKPAELQEDLLSILLKKKDESILSKYTKKDVEKKNAS